MTKTAKGTRNERKCEEELKRQGFVTWRVRRNRFANMDLFGLFDVAGWDRKTGTLVFLQVKSNRVDRKTLNAVADFNLHSPAGCHGAVWVWKDRKGWEYHYGE